METQSMEPEANFETSLKRLETTVAELESGRLGLDDALARYETGVGLLAKCYAMLDVADRKVALLIGVDENGQPETAPFDASATMDRETIAPKKKAKPPQAQNLEDLPF